MGVRPNVAENDMLNVAVRQGSELEMVCFRSARCNNSYYRMLCHEDVSCTRRWYCRKRSKLHHHLMRIVSLGLLTRSLLVGFCGCWFNDCLDVAISIDLKSFSII